MREVDEALARAYAQHEQSDPPQGVPPAPHWPARALTEPTSTRPIAPGRRRDRRSSCSGLRSCSPSSESGANGLKRWRQLLLDGAGSGRISRSCSSPVAIAPRAGRRWCSPWRAPLPANPCAPWWSMPT